MPTLDIIGMPQSNFVWACRIAAEEKLAQYELIVAGPQAPELTAIHPLGRMPVMRHGTVRLFESRAICAYIDAVFPGPSLTPEPAVERAAMEQWISLLNTALHPDAIRPYIFSYLFPGTADGSPNREGIAATLPGLMRGLATLDRAVTPTGCLVGTGFTLADAFLLPLLHYLAMLPESGEALAGLRDLSAYHARHRGRPSIERTVPPPLPK